MERKNSLSFENRSGSLSFEILTFQEMDEEEDNKIWENMNNELPSNENPYEEFESMEINLFEDNENDKKIIVQLCTGDGLVNGIPLDKITQGEYYSVKSALASVNRA